jgi:BASS family bile acid:Na+ symporter
MLLRPLLPAAAERLSEGMLAFGGVVLSLAGLALLAMHGRLLVASGLGPLLALLGMTVVALAVGHLFGGPDPGDRAALAVSCASRHVGIALLAASSVPGPRTAALVLAYVLASVVVSAVYLRLRARPARKDAARDATPPGDQTI